MPEFMPGLQLSELFYREVIKDILERGYGGLAYSAGLIGYGSDVIGFDTPRSTDHMWGPRLYLFLTEADHTALAADIAGRFGHELPYNFRGYDVNFSAPDPNDNGVRHPQSIDSGPVNPLIWIKTVRGFFEEYLNYTPSTEITLPAWLTFPEHRLLAVTAGGIFHDDLGLTALRHKLAYYPDQVWFYMLVAQWAKLSEEEAFVGRGMEVGDELGSRLIAARLVHSLMRLSFLMARQYAPYSKWFGSAFARLPLADRLSPALQTALTAPAWPEREAALVSAYEIVAEAHNALGLTDPLETKTTLYFDRPYQVIYGGRFSEAIQALITDEHLQRIPANLGSVSQLSDATAVYDNLAVCHQLKRLYTPN